MRSSIRRLVAPVAAFFLTIWLLASPVNAVEDAGKVDVVSIGLFGGVFRSEATGAAQVVAGRFETGPIDVEYNSKTGGNATIEAPTRSLHAAANRLDAKKDVLFLFSPRMSLQTALQSRRGGSQKRSRHLVSAMLAKTGVRHKVVVISACYSGVFVRRLATPDVLVITAADANHPSFGCQDKAKWTNFCDAFFNIALRKAVNLKDAFLDARSLVRRRKLREHFEPSNPLMAGGEDVLSLLVGRP